MVFPAPAPVYSPDPPDQLDFAIVGLTATIDGVTASPGFDNVWRLNRVASHEYDTGVVFSESPDDGIYVYESVTFPVTWPDTGVSTHEGQVVLVSDRVAGYTVAMLCTRVLTNPNYSENRIKAGRRDFVAIGDPGGSNTNQSFSWGLTSPAQDYYQQPVEWVNLDTGNSGVATINDGVATCGLTAIIPVTVPVSDALVDYTGGTYYHNPSSVDASLDLELPPGPADADWVRVVFGGTIAYGDPVVTSLTFSGGEVFGAPTSANSGDVLTLQYSLLYQRWYIV